MPGPMLAILSIVTMAACASTAGKDEVPCGASWEANPPIEGTCDSACAEMMVGSGPSCTTSVTYSTGKVACASTFEYDGERGCCFDTGRVSQVGGISGEPNRRRRVFFLSCD